MKQYILILAILLVAGCKSDKALITGALSDSYNGKIYLSHIDDMIKAVDSCEVKDGHFRFDYPVNLTDIYILTTPDNNIYQPIILDKGYIISIDLKDPKEPVISVKNGQEQIALNNLNTLMKEYNNKIFADGVNFEEANRKIIETIDSIPNTLAAIYTAGNMLALRPEDYIHLYSVIDTVGFAHSYYFRGFKKKYLEESAKYLVGSEAPDFIAKDLSGREFKLSEHRGKYIYLDFWASWCHSCRSNNKVLAAKYKTLPSDLVVISFSMDDDKKLWAEASKKDGITWHNISDLAGFKNSQIGAKYRFANLPAVYIIDPNGIVLAQDVEVDQIMDYIK